jgi:hypothetical protein
MPHPSGSPDLNLIEPLWHRFKDHVCNCKYIPTTSNELKVAAKEAWNQMTLADIDKHVNKMEDCVQAVLKAKGSHTRF